MNIAHNIYERLNTVEDLDHLLDERQNECLHLEFKRKREPDVPSLSDGLDSNLSYAISGFANAEGGVLVLGIDAPLGELSRNFRLQIFQPLKLELMNISRELLLLE